MPSHRLTANPFHVLSLSPRATRAEVESAGRSLLAALADRLPGAECYQTPLGSQVRDAHLVRRALTQLRDTDERIHHEIWAQASPRSLPGPLPGSEGPRIAGWPDAPRAMGWWAR